MTKTLFEQICDKVGAWKDFGASVCGYIGDCVHPNNKLTCEDLKCEHLTHKIYTQETAEIVLRLEELIIDWCKKSKISPICLPYLVIGKNLYQIWFKKKCIYNSYEDTRPEALYSLIIKLLDEKVLSAEDVKGAICG